jgi:beta-1,4-mannosyltransferase
MRILAWPVKSSTNPYTSLVYSALGPRAHVDPWPGNLARRYDIWHVHWPDALLNISNSAHAAFKIAGMFAASDIMRARGTKLIWTIHNLSSHEALHPRLESWFWRQFIHRVDGAISLSDSGLAAATQRFPQLEQIPTTVIRHGHYRDKGSYQRESARVRLALPEHATTALFFGAIRSYKNVDLLVRAFRDVKSPDAILCVVGNPNSMKLAGEIQKEASLDSRVHIKFRFVENHEVPLFLSAADLVVLPYRDVLNSGSALMALSCNRPVLVPNLGSMSELQKDFSSNWVQTYDGPLTAAVLEEGFSWAANSRHAECSLPKSYSWETIGNQTLLFYETVIANPAHEGIRSAGSILQENR